MAGKSFFIDTSLCTACRGCQMACKNWNQLPGTKTVQKGSYQNPEDLSFHTYKLVRFKEVEAGNKVRWNFFPDQCRHCVVPPCKEAADGYVKGAITICDRTGAVVYDPKLTQKLPFEEIRDACPYNIPRQDPGTESIAKCTMCIDRLQAGLVPACVKICPTGTMNFGERDQMLDLANKRLAEAKKKFPKAMLVDPDDVRAIYLIVDDAENYHYYVMASNAWGISRKVALRRLIRPFVPIIGGPSLV